MIKLSKLKLNPGNPRKIAEAKMERLKKSLQDFERMMELRPIVVDEGWTVLGGNMRLQALKQLGFKEVPDEWVKMAEGLTEEQKREFIIKDNVGFGEWDWEMLGNEWESGQLTEWGLDVPDWQGEQLDYSDKNKEIDAEGLEEKMSITLQYTFEEYEKVRDALSRIAATPEQAVWILLKLDDE